MQHTNTNRWLFPVTRVVPLGLVNCSGSQSEATLPSGQVVIRQHAGSSGR